MSPRSFVITRFHSCASVMRLDRMLRVTELSDAEAVLLAREVCKRAREVFTIRLPDMNPRITAVVVMGGAYALAVFGGLLFITP
jgi:hypothetical protein